MSAVHVRAPTRHGLVWVCLRSHQAYCTVPRSLCSFFPALRLPSSPASFPPFLPLPTTRPLAPVVTSAPPGHTVRFAVEVMLGGVTALTKRARVMACGVETCRAKACGVSCLGDHGQACGEVLSAGGGLE